jgi:pimeloyl-ACP methyl ester carboxylesterase
MAYRHGNDAESALAHLSPDYTDDESRHIWDGNDFATPVLLPQVLSLNLNVKKLGCPLILLEGRHDTNVNAEVAAEWFAKVAAPEKHLVWFEHSAHMPMTEEPGKFLISLVRYGRPIAERAGDAAP